MWTDRGKPEAISGVIGPLEHVDGSGDERAERRVPRFHRPYSFTIKVLTQSSIKTEGRQAMGCDDEGASACPARRGGLAAADLADAPGRAAICRNTAPSGRARATSSSSARRPTLAAEVTLQPVQRFGFDAAILFSDILMLPWALGHGLRFEDGEGPVLPPLRDATGISALKPRRLPRRSRPSWRRSARSAPGSTTAPR